MHTKHRFSHRSLRGVLVALPALASVACGGSDHPSDGSTESANVPANFPKDKLPKELVADLPIVAPTSDTDIPVFSGIVDVAPGDDVTFCTWTNVVLDHDTIFAESFGAESPEGHHAILQYTSQVQDPHTGSCGAMDGNMLLGGSGGKNVADQATLPKNFGVKVPAGSQLVINHHWINTTDEAVKGQAMMLARPLPDGGDTVLAGNFPMLGLGWTIPAQGQLSYSTECTYAEDVSYVLALGHMHEYGQHVNIDVEHAAGGSESLIDLAWSPDSGTTAGGRIFTLEDPYVIHKGDTVKLTCNWANNTAEDIGFPREMCIFFGYTVGTNAFCANGAWLTPDQVAGAGVDPQDITNNL
ncbi:MAG TPA: hypothetical protein VHE30_30240 [Polyangiaceae bacterium]|nr:hypothetical protein [Polyangiaceae bacterium]